MFGLNQFQCLATLLEDNIVQSLEAHLELMSPAQSLEAFK